MLGNENDHKNRTLLEGSAKNDTGLAGPERLISEAFSDFISMQVLWKRLSRRELVQKASARFAALSRPYHNWAYATWLAGLLPKRVRDARPECV